MSLPIPLVAACREEDLPRVGFASHFSMTQRPIARGDRRQ